MLMLQFSYVHGYMYSASYCHTLVTLLVLEKLILLENACIDISLTNMEEPITK